MASKRFKKLHNAQTQVSEGDSIIVDNVSSLVVSIQGTSTTFSIQFVGSIDGVNYFPISGNKLSDYAVFSTTATAIGEAWEFDVSGLYQFKAKLTSISNGNISVTANAFGWVD